VVVALLEPLGVGDAFPASRWPLHITLSTNFDTAAEPDAVAEAVARVASLSPAVTIAGGERAMFGAHHTTPVTLVEPREPLAEMHAALVARLASQGAVFLYPEHLGDGYRPHAAVQAHGRPRPVRLRTGQRVRIDRVALIDRSPDGDRRMRRVVSVHSLAVGGSGPEQNHESFQGRP
jgi:hypothetical protein